MQGMQLSLRSMAESWHSVKRFERGTGPRRRRWRGGGQTSRLQQSSHVKLPRPLRGASVDRGGEQRGLQGFALW